MTNLVFLTADDLSNAIDNVAARVEISEDFPEKVFVRMNLSEKMFCDGFELRHQHVAFLLGAKFEDLAPEHQRRLVFNRPESS